MPRVTRAGNRGRLSYLQLSHYRVSWLVPTAAVERAHSDRARSGSTGTSHATLFSSLVCLCF
jgi:hypothetical protein